MVVITHWSTSRQSQQLLQSILDAAHDPLVIRGLVPYAENILVSPHRYHRPANLAVRHVGEPPQQREHHLFPITRANHSLLRKTYGPSAPVGVIGILPSGIDALAEEMVVGCGG